MAVVYFVNCIFLLASVKTGEICNVLEKISNLDKQCVSDFCEPIKINMDDAQDPCITAFKVDTAVIEVLPKFQKLQHSLVFLKIWDSCCNSLKQQCTTLEDVVKHVWTPAENRFVTVQIST